MHHYMIDDESLSSQFYRIVDAEANEVLLVKRLSWAKVQEIVDALNTAYEAGSKGPSGFQEGFDHGVAVGHREGRVEASEEAYARGRADYHEELWNREGIELTGDMWVDEIAEYRESSA